MADQLAGRKDLTWKCLEERKKVHAGCKLENYTRPHRTGIVTQEEDRSIHSLLDTLPVLDTAPCLILQPSSQSRTTALPLLISPLPSKVPNRLERKATKHRHVDGAWTDPPVPPVQAEFLDWWSDSKTTSSRRNDAAITQPQTRRILSVPKLSDKLISLPSKRMGSCQMPRTTLRRDVEVMGELKPTRWYVHAFTICGREMEVWVFDRLGCYSPGAFDIHEKPERFIQVIAGYTMINDEELGLDTFTELDGDSRLIRIEQDEASSRTRLRLESQPFTRQRAIVCRGASCYLTKPPDSENWSYVAKFSWTSDRRKPEADLLRLGRLTPSEVFQALRRIFRILSPCLSLPPLRKRKPVDVGRKSKRSRSNSQRSSQGQDEVTYDVGEAQRTSLLAPNIGPYDSRVFRCLVISPAGRAIHKHISTYTSKAKFRRQCSHSQNGRDFTMTNGPAWQDSGTACETSVAALQNKTPILRCVRGRKHGYRLRNGSREYESNMFIVICLK
ncbi:FunK1 protein kinase [Hirsutella rhossiliensis]